MANQSEPGARLAQAGFVLGQWTPAETTAYPDVPLWKRAFDIMFAISALVFFMPVLVGLFLVIKFTQGGRVLFAHERIGHGGKPFKCLKFRTMVPDAQQVLDALLESDPVARAEWETQQKLTNDPRVTCIGRFLRKSSLDELPQFWNVLRGDMSIVGPRPIIVQEAHHYREHLADYKSVRPGITGNWQVNGRSTTTFAQRVAMDVDYVRNASLRRDVGIVLKTVTVVLGGEGAH